MGQKKSKGKHPGVSVDNVKNAALDAISLIEKNLSGTLNPELRVALENLKSAVGEVTQKESGKGLTLPLSDQVGPERFEVLGALRRVLMAMDMLFLSRQTTYHIAAPAEMQRVFADKEKIKFVFAKVLEHIVRRAPRPSRIEIGIKDYSFRGSPGIEIVFSSDDRYFEELDKQKFLVDLFQGKADEISGVALAECREALIREQGQLWVDISKSRRIVYHMVLPISEKPKPLCNSSQQTFKYDISISNYAEVRKRFGKKKSASLVNQIEQYVKALVRYPIDMVMSVGEKGIITTIYETPHGSAQSVASRISQRLGNETFHIGRKSVDVLFSYRLSTLAVQSGQKQDRALLGPIKGPLEAS